MHDYLRALILGIVQGLTEFLPVSSTGHLILVNQWVALEDPFATMFYIVIQAGAILAVVVRYWKRLFPFQTSLGTAERGRIWLLWGKVTVAVLPALGAGYLLDEFLEKYLMRPVVVSFALIFYGIVLLLVERKPWEPRYGEAADFPWPMVTAVGFIQCLALVPGTSRSAATIIGALLLGSSRRAAAEFSFFLAVPTLTAASLYSLLKYKAPLSGHELATLGIGFGVSFLVAWAVISLFIDWVSKRNFRPFGWYRIVVGGAVLAYFLTRG